MIIIYGIKFIGNHIKKLYKKEDLIEETDNYLHFKGIKTEIVPMPNGIPWETKKVDYEIYIYKLNIESIEIFYNEVPEGE